MNNFLNFLRSENLQKEDVDLNNLISGVLQLYNRECAVQGIEVETEFQEPFVLSVDPERFKTVLLNVVLNAIQAMPDGGKLNITTDGQRKLIRISDTGEGIPEKNLENIFDLFYTTKSAGTGLGLPTAYKIVKEHGGDISIKSETGKGTVVEIAL
ncbi:MAG: ATP-binding protein [Calditrichia bacterium]